LGGRGDQIYIEFALNRRYEKNRLSQLWTKLAMLHVPTFIIGISYDSLMHFVVQLRMDMTSFKRTFLERILMHIYILHCTYYFE
jgi:hypothetical protein